jgi:hypothetical protein
MSTVDDLRAVGYALHPSGVLPDHVAAFVGEEIDFGASAIALSTNTATLTRRPGTSAATVVGTAVTFDTPGRYVVDTVLNSLPRRFGVTAWPVSVKTWPEIQYMFDGTTVRPDGDVRAILSKLSDIVPVVDYSDLSLLEVAVPVLGLAIGQMLARGGLKGLGPIGG